MGHVSLQTYGKDGIYASFWPTRPVSFSSVLHRVPAEFAATSEEDEKERMKSPPTEIIHLDSLDAVIINNLFRAFKDSKYQWSLLGHTFFVTPDNRNCCSLTLFLLQKAGLAKLLARKETWKKYGGQLGKLIGPFFGSVFADLRLAKLFFHDKASAFGQALHFITDQLPDEPICLWDLDRKGKIIGKAIGAVLDLRENRLITPFDMVKILKLAEETDSLFRQSLAETEGKDVKEQQQFQLH